MQYVIFFYVDGLSISNVRVFLLCVLQWYVVHIDQHEQLLNQLNTALKHHPEFEHAFSDFESQKICYLPIGAFLLKPIQRLIHYRSLFERESVWHMYKAYCLRALICGNVDL